MKKKCEHCGAEFISARSYRKYCSDVCRSRAAMTRSGKAAKTVECKSCGVEYKRRSALDTLCLECREKYKKIKKSDIPIDQIPKTDRETELSMIDAWLKENTPKLD